MRSRETDEDEDEAGTHLKHVGHDASSAPEGDAAGAVVIWDGGRSLRLGGALRDNVLVPVGQEASLAEPGLWKRLKGLVGKIR